MFQTKIEGTTLYYKLPGRDWFLQDEYDTKEKAQAQEKVLLKTVSHEGSIAFQWHPKKGVMYVFHTAMYRLGFAARNAEAKGFGSLIELYRRPATPADNIYFLSGTRAKWTIYENLKSLIDDEKAFAPDHVAELEKAIGNRKWKAVAENLFTATLYD